MKVMKKPAKKPVTGRKATVHVQESRRISCSYQSIEVVSGVTLECDESEIAATNKKAHSIIAAEIEKDTAKAYNTIALLADRSGK